MRIVGLDAGERRIGIAISDATATLARPVGVLEARGLDTAAVKTVADEVTRLSAEDDPVSSIVVGLPRRLDGSPNDMTARVERFASALGARWQATLLHFQGFKNDDGGCEHRFGF